MPLARGTRLGQYEILEPRLRAVILLAAGLLATTSGRARAQQVADSAFRPVIPSPTHSCAAGPVVAVDTGHNNATTVRHQFRPFTDLLSADCYRVEFVGAPLTRAALRGSRVLVIINALHSSNVVRHIVPIASAFDSAEVRGIVEWIHGGGSLLIAADHMPFAGAAESLAQRLGATFTDGFAVDTASWDPIVFRRSDGSLASHPITDGRTASERIDSIATFDGQGFRAHQGVYPLMTFGRGVISYYPDTAWRFPQPWVPTRSMEGWHQGAVAIIGAGRVLLLGESGMLSAQVAGRKRYPMGMNAPVASQNQLFVLNAFRWLSGLLPVN